MIDAQKSKPFFGYIVAAAGFWIWFILYGAYCTFGVFFVPVSAEFGWSRADTSLALSLNGLISGLLSLIMGLLTDKLGPRIVVIFFGSFSGIAYLLLSHTTTLWQFILYHALFSSIGISTVSIPIMATVSRWFIKRRGLMSGIVQSGLSIGGFIILPVTGWIITGYGWRTAYVALGIFTLAGTALSGLFLRRDPQSMGLFPDNARAKSDPGNKKSAAELTPASLSVRQIFFTSQFWVLAGLYFSFGFCRSTFITHIAPHVQDLGFTLAQGANVLAIINLSSILGRIAMGRCGDVMGIRKAMMISYTATVVDILWGLYTRSLWGLYCYAVIFGFGWGAQAVLRFPATVEAFGLHSTGFIMGILGVFENVVAASVGIWIGGYIFDSVGNYWPIYWTGLVISIVAVILASMVKPLPYSESFAKPEESI
ncbi:MAG: MFS transporter [Deltaproteobacteria bacterium]|nr:MFS transporter [Deltaproteobacteria bacterium]